MEVIKGKYSLIVLFFVIFSINSCSYITIVRTKELNEARDSVIVNLNRRVDSLETQIDSIKVLIVNLQNAFASFNEQAMNMLRSDRLAIKMSLNRLDRQLAFLEDKLERSQYELKKISSKVGEFENIKVAVYEKNKSDSLDIDNIKSKELYELAYSDYIGRRYDLAISEFKELLQKYPNSIFVDKALFYLGLLYKDIRNEPDSAIYYYDSLITNYKESSYTKSAILKLIDIYQSKGDYKKAYNLAKKLIDEYFASPEAKIAQDKLEELEQKIKAKRDENIKNKEEDNEKR